MSRRLPALVVTLVGLAALAIAGRTTPAPETAAFSTVAASWMPVAPEPSGLTGSWFCPGVPASGEEGVGGELVVSNRGDAPLEARVELLGEDGTAVTSVTVAPRARTVVDVDALVESRFVSAVVEIDGGGGLVEQRALHPAGNTVAACANATSDTWYFADGFTVGGSVNQIVLSNPYDDVVIVDVGFATAEGSRVPGAFQGFPIAPRSVEVIDFGVAGAGAQGEEVLAVKVEATRGRLVAGRAQHFLDGGRLGATMTLGAPALRDQWWFADGAKGADVRERFSLYNPTDDDVEVDAIFLGIAEFADVEPIVVPARQVVTFDPGSVATLPEGRHAVVFSTLAEPSIVVERALSVVDDEGRPWTSVLLGAPPRPDGYVPTTWHLGIGPEEPTPSALVVYNIDNTAATVTIEAVGPDGVAPVPGLEAVAVGAASRVEIALDAPEALGRELVVRSTSRIFVERSLPSGAGSARTSSWALPAG